LSEILDEEPQLLIIIDDKNEELEIASKNLPFATRINIFKTFCREGFGLGDNIFQFDTFTSAKKITKEKFLESTPNEQTFERQTTQREPGKKRSPSAPEWIQQIPELSGLKGLYKWTDLCDHFNLRHQGNSARRVFQKWVERNKPNWVAVPDA
jgi:hypothetical protein